MPASPSLLRPRPRVLQVAVRVPAVTRAARGLVAVAVAAAAVVVVEAVCPVLVAL